MLTSVLYCSPTEIYVVNWMDKLNQGSNPPSKSGNCTNRSSIETGAVMIQASERQPPLESFTTDASYQRRAEHIVREVLGVELHVTAKPK